MARRCFCIALVFVSLLALGSATWTKCPPPGFDSAKDFDAEKFIKHTWYVQEQSVVAFQALDTFYCGLATYEPKNKDNILDGLTVYNYANRGKVNGAQMGTSGAGGPSTWYSDLEAVIPDATDPSKLLVGLTVIGSLLPRPLLPVVYGPYWVDAVGLDENGEHKWAIISGGAPEVPGTDGCKTAFDFAAPYQVNGVGLWLFARKPVDPASTKEMRSVAKDLGFDISVLFPVEQEGCLYEGAVLK